MRLFWGARDTILPILQGTAISALLENCDLIRFERCGHFVQWEEPETLAGALRAFLDAPNAPSIRLRKSAPAPDQVLCGSEKNGSVSAYCDSGSPSRS
jgi:hypothetical protein